MDGVASASGGTDMIELKPCPFCGGEAEYNYNMELIPDGIRCMKCKYILRYLGMPKATGATPFEKIMEPMAERWNRRTE